MAVYLVKGAEPAKARDLIRKEMGETGVASWLFFSACFPPETLRAAASLRACWLKLRHHPAFVSSEVRAVLQRVRPLLDAELQTP